VVQRPSDPVNVARLRTLCMELPGVTEKLSHGELAWFVRGKQFANTADHHHDDRLAVWIAAPPGAQVDMVSEDPTLYFRPPYVGHRGWLGVYLDGDGLDWNDLARIVAVGYQTVAQKK
jgi:hypothetical protein